MKRRAFTLIELLLAVSLVSVVIAASFAALSTITSIWRGASSLTEEVHRADVVMDQIAMAIRSAYYPDAGDPPPQGYGMQIINDGDEDEAHDMLEWVKCGGALIGSGSLLASSPHKIRLWTAKPGALDGDLSPGGIAIKSWPVSPIPEDFDPEDDEQAPPFLFQEGDYSLEIKLLDPRDNLAKGQMPKKPEEWNPDTEEMWIDEEWQSTGNYTNRLPHSVKLSLYLPGAKDGKERTVLTRVVLVPVAPHSWSAKKKKKENAPRRHVLPQGAWRPDRPPPPRPPSSAP